jgi:hypothetical protein
MVVVVVVVVVTHTQVSCSDGANGLITRWGYPNLRPLFPGVAASGTDSDRRGFIDLTLFPFTVHASHRAMFEIR